MADFARELEPQWVQLWYQMAIMGRKELYLAPSARTGFEMTLLRMLAFVPMQLAAHVQTAKPVKRDAGKIAERDVKSNYRTDAAGKYKLPNRPRWKCRCPVASDSCYASCRTVRKTGLRLLPKLNLKGPLGQVGVHSAIYSPKRTATCTCLSCRLAR